MYNSKETNWICEGFSHEEINMIVNKSRNQLKLKKKLEENGYKDVKVWWEVVRGGPEMCGPEGGFFFSSKEHPIEPLGYSFIEAYEYIDNFFTKGDE